VVSVRRSLSLLLPAFGLLFPLLSFLGAAASSIMFPDDGDATGVPRCSPAGDVHTASTVAGQLPYLVSRRSPVDHRSLVVEHTTPFPRLTFL